MAVGVLVSGAMAVTLMQPAADQATAVPPAPTFAAPPAGPAVPAAPPQYAVATAELGHMKLTTLLVQPPVETPPAAAVPAGAAYREGMAAVRRGDMTAAHALLQRALERDPALAPARQELLALLVADRRWPEAQQVAQSGLALDPAQSGWAIILARLQIEQGDAAGAVATLERHAVHADRDAEYQGLFAYLLQKQRRSREAAERFTAALALRPDESRWWFGLGTALEAAGSGDKARLAYVRARENGKLPAEMAAVVAEKLR